MDEQASDIVAILTESGTKTRRERAAFVAKLRDEMGLTFSEIGRQVNVSPQRAQQLYSLHKVFQRSAKSPFADLSTRARNVLNRVASYNKLPEDWEQHPDQIAALVHAIASMTETEARKFRQFGARTVKEIADFMQSQGVQFPFPQLGEALEDEGELDPKLLTHGVPVDMAMEILTDFFNKKDLRGEFKVWPPGTYTGPYAENAEFVVTMSGFLADAFEEGWSVRNEFDALVKGLGLHCEMATQTVLTFYIDPYIAPSFD